MIPIPSASGHTSRLERKSMKERFLRLSKTSAKQQPAGHSFIFSSSRPLGAGYLPLQLRIKTENNR